MNMCWGWAFRNMYSAFKMLCLRYCSEAADT